MIAKFACLSFGLTTFMIGVLDNMFWVAAFGALGAAFMAVQTIVSVISNNRTKRMEIEFQQAHSDIREIKKATDGMNTAAVKAGVAEGKESERVKNIEAQANVEKGKQQEKQRSSK